ncbi:hypothetical protein Q5752_005062 [Cryptotrichosporon argae]
MDPHDSDIPKEHHVPRTGDWLSQDRRHHHKFLSSTIAHVDANPTPLDPVLAEFRDAIYASPRLRMLFEQMFDQVPKGKKYLTDASGENAQVRDFEHLLKLLNHVLTTAPAWTDNGHKKGLVGVPVNALLDWPMATTAGYAVFLDPEVNAWLKKILDKWGGFLSSPESAYVLGTDDASWFSPHGIQSLEAVANLYKPGPSFAELFQCDPSAEHHGYASWDAFFTRLFRDGVRPVASPDDDRVIANACESRVYKVARDVSAREKFWVKGQPYSVLDMLANDADAEVFVGGTVYQAFLSALSYHRWHAPVSGTIKRAYVVPGTYFSEPLYDDFKADGEGADPQGESTSQEYISVTATRAIILIDNPTLGLIAFLGIGMTEVSTCEITVKEGQTVKKGDQLGMFHFGGSTHTVLFNKNIKVSSFPEPSEHNVPVRSRLAVVE